MRILVDALAVIGGITLALGGGVIGWCFLQSAADRREGRRVIAQQDHTIAVTGPSDAQIERMIRDYYKGRRP